MQVPLIDNYVDNHIKNQHEKLLNRADMYLLCRKWNYWGITRELLGKFLGNYWVIIGGLLGNKYNLSIRDRNNCV